MDPAWGGIYRLTTTATDCGPPAHFRSVDLALVTLPVRGPKPELLKLPGGGAGKLVAELDLLRAFVPGQKCPAVGDHVLLGDGDPVIGHHQCGDHFAPGVVRDADDRDLSHAGQRE